MIIHGYHLFQTSLFVCFISEARSFVRRGGPVVGLMGFVASKNMGWLGDWSIEKKQLSLIQFCHWWIPQLAIRLFLDGNISKLRYKPLDGRPWKTFFWCCGRDLCRSIIAVQISTVHLSESLVKMASSWDIDGGMGGMSQLPWNIKSILFNYMEWRWQQHSRWNPGTGPSPIHRKPILYKSV